MNLPVLSNSFLPVDSFTQDKFVQTINNEIKQKNTSQSVMIIKSVDNKSVDTNKNLTNNINAASNKKKVKEMKLTPNKK